MGGGVQMQDHWAAFAISLDPNAPLPDASPRVTWPRTMPGRPRTLKFGNDKTQVARAEPRADFCGWSDHF